MSRKVLYQLSCRGGCQTSAIHRGSTRSAAINFHYGKETKRNANKEFYSSVLLLLCASENANPTLTPYANIRLASISGLPFMHSRTITARWWHAANLLHLSIFKALYDRGRILYDIQPHTNSWMRGSGQYSVCHCCTWHSGAAWCRLLALYHNGTACSSISLLSQFGAICAPITSLCLRLGLFLVQKPWFFWHYSTVYEKFFFTVVMLVKNCSKQIVILTACSKTSLTSNMLMEKIVPNKSFASLLRDAIYMKKIAI